MMTKMNDDENPILIESAIGGHRIISLDLRKSKHEWLSEDGVRKWLGSGYGLEVDLPCEKRKALCAIVASVGTVIFYFDGDQYDLTDPAIQIKVSEFLFNKKVKIYRSGLLVSEKVYRCTDDQVDLILEVAQRFKDPLRVFYYEKMAFFLRAKTYEERQEVDSRNMKEISEAREIYMSRLSFLEAIVFKIKTLFLY